MKQLLLTLGMIVALGGGLLAQDVIWTEDFGQGLRGWTATTSICQEFNGGMYGTWDLATATVAGTPVDISLLDFEWSFMSSDIYTIDWEWQDGSDDYGSIYANYAYSGDTLLSTIVPEDVVANGSAFDENALGHVLWGAVLGDVAPAQLPVVLHLIGANDPIVTMDGTTMTMTSQDGAVVLTYERTNSCGDLWYWNANSNWSLGYTGGTNGIQLASDVQNGCATVSPFHLQRLLGFPEPYPEYIAELISPPIDISAADQALSLELTQAFNKLNTADGAPGGVQLSFQVSVDDGATWQAAIDLAPTVGPNALTRDRRDNFVIPSSQIGDATSIRLKFNFAGDFYLLAIDDVTLVERNPYDMQANTNFYAIAPNWATPWSQLTPMAFMSDIQNNGGATATNVNLEVGVFDEGGARIHTGNLNYGDITPDSLAENSFIPGILDITPDAGSVGQYVGFYALTHDSTAAESDATNDSLFFDFIVTDTLYSKAPTATRSISPADDDSYLFGNIFYVPRGQGWFARTITFQMTNADEIANYQNNTATVLLYEWDGDVNPVDDQANPEEYGNNAVGVTEYIFDGTETGLITVPIVDLIEGEAIPLQDDKYYMAVLQFVAAQADDVYRIAAAENTYDYGATAFISDSLSITGELPATYYGPVLEVGNPAGEAVTFSTFAFGRNRVPIVEMSIGLNGDLSKDPLVSSDDVLPADYVVETFPNPATEFFTLNLDMPEMQDVSVVVYDLKGQTLFFQEYDDLQTGNFRYDVSTLPAGMYFVRVTTAAGARTLKVSVQR